MAGTLTFRRPIWSLVMFTLCCFALIRTVQADPGGVTPLDLTPAEQQWIIDHPSVKVAFDGHYAPYSFIGEDGNFAGVAVDITREVFRRAGVRLEPYPESKWSTLYNDALKRDVDVIATLVKLPGREAWFSFSRPYLSLSQYIISRKQSLHQIHQKSDLKGLKVAMVTGYSMAEVVLREYPTIEPVFVDTLEDALKTVDQGRADATIADIGMAHYLVRLHQLNNLAYAALYSADQSRQAFGIRNDWPELAGILNKALASLTDQELLNIYARWTLPNIPQISNNLFGLTARFNEEQQNWLEAQTGILVGVMASWPPINYLNSQDEPDGIGADYLQELNRIMGGKLQPVYGEWKSLYQDLEQGKIDVLMDLTPSPERARSFLFTQAYLNIPHVIVARKESAPLSSETDLKGKTLALEEGFGNVKYFAEKYPGVSLKLYPSTREALNAVARGDADAYAGNRAVALHIISRDLITNLRIFGELNKEGSVLAFGIRKDKPLLASILEQALNSITPQVRERINLRWIGGDRSFVETNLTPQEQAWLKAHPLIRLASDISWPPYESIDSNGNYQGIAADYISLLETRLGIQFEISPVKSWQTITEMVRNKELDLFPAAMKTPQRLTYAEFTRPYLYSPMVIVTRKDVGYIEDLSTLDDKPIAIEAGYASYDLLSQSGLNLNLKPYTDSLSAMLAVSSGKAFAYIGNIATLGQLMQQSGITNLKVSGQTPYQFELAMGVRKDWPMLTSILQKALDSITAEEKHAILKKWVDIKLEKPLSLTYLWYFAGGALGIALLSLFWNFALNRKVRQRTRQLQHQARYDSLTTLPNRTQVLEQLEVQLNPIIGSADPLAVLFIDLDDFKRINDTLGHETGDQILMQAGQRLGETVRDRDIVGRLGGDEFVILLFGLLQADDAGRVAEKLHHLFSEPFCIGGRELVVTCSIGIALYPADGRDSSELLRNADTAMYHSKKLGRNTYSFYTASMNQIVQRNLELEEQMHGALERNEFYLCYQPQVHAATGRVVAFEALLRWKNPALGNVFPDEFIPVAEHNGMIVPIGKFVLKQGLLLLRQLQQRFDRNYSLSVNLSPRQFRDTRLVGSIIEILQDCGVSARSLDLEITEGVLLSGLAYVQENLTSLKEIGVRLSMDDFGSGYSSLSYLRNYPFDSLKIDREFIMDITHDSSDLNLVKGTIAMAHSLNLQVVAEGVETLDQANLLKSLQCDLLQGYLYSKPLPEDQIIRYLEQQTGHISTPDPHPLNND
ncbi:transporter substrate-binding domain-containing protein [Neptuniibacter sp. CAU 1671]|uniref:transporter substrate-binding domain-containing protein n=1 Tax=Neptuniibacter sp. CAU 1671 TaxID=3032593 RepID=UPI0023D9EC47|nr:transporter substrate-binding domain-containing protein [Neptuniibacter sp. CAU 1671]MDF2182384.1 transporter substrate-binding domain-containing protein [Neptuniibacter sp. CAU 1671]